uniref:Uncharacterized protein n=1 Tax=Propithecus coquereli TaxID=379532 RepID=A0A2K6FA19_PROCO
MSALGQITIAVCGESISTNQSRAISFVVLGQLQNCVF